MMLGMIAVIITCSGAMIRFDNLHYDLGHYLCAKPAPTDIVIVAIDEASLRQIGRWPWSRTVHADLVSNLKQARAKAIGLDIIFAEPELNQPEADLALAQALQQAGNVVLPELLEAPYAKGPIKHSLPVAILADSAAALGRVHVPLDVDGIARSIYLWEGLGGSRTQHFSQAVLQLSLIHISGNLLAQGDKLSTGQYSVAKLRFADDSVVVVQQNSNIEIHASYQIAGRETYVTLLKLNRGRTEIGANPSHTIGNSLQVETPSAIAAVRGTQFRVAADGDIALQETLDGQVAFSGAEHGVLQTVLLAKGYGSVIEKNQAPLAPIVLPEVPNVSGLPSQLEQVDVAFELKPRPGDTAFVSQLARDAEFTQIIQQQTTPAMPTTKVLLGALVDGQYFLRLRAQESHGLQGQDAIHAFTVKARPIAILELLEPAAVGISSAPITFCLLYTSRCV